MKKIEAIIDPSKLEEVKNALTKIGIRRMTISKVDEFGSQEAHKEFYRAKEYVVDVVKEFKIELIVTTDEMLSQVIETIEKTGNISEEEIFISPMEEVTQFRNTKKGGRDEKNRSHCQTI
jgi:nitrogen regulatory protein P-II 1